MKLDTKHLRYLTAEDWRVLTAVEMGSKNHESVPTSLIIQLSNLRSGSGVHKCISTLAKANLIARMKNAKYDGYRLTYGGLDYLALHTHLKRSTLYSTGPCVGAGKESDIYICAPPSNNNNTQLILKIHRLGRISFRSIKNNRDYLRHRSSASWMYMSRLAAQKEFAFMKVLHDNGFDVPEPVAWSRHTVVMSLVEGVPLRAVKKVGDPAALYGELMEIILRLAKFGLIHGDFNEFNIMIREEESYQSSEDMDIDDHPPKITPVLIDFPQTVSTSHQNAEFYFTRDVNCIKTFFASRFHFTSSEPGPFFQDAVKLAGRKRVKRLDVEVEASGFSKTMARELEKYMQEFGVDGRGESGESGEDYEDASADHDLVEQEDGNNKRPGNMETGDGEGTAKIPPVTTGGLKTVAQ
ncbi:MAG: hypothetical protein Q9217_004501 [Psora testacea]